MELDEGNMSRERAMSEKQEELLFGNMPKGRRKTIQIVCGLPGATPMPIEQPTLKNCLVANSVMYGSHELAPMTIAVSELASEFEESPILRERQQQQSEEKEKAVHIVNPAFLGDTEK
jgi:hypothetical protein